MGVWVVNEKASASAPGATVLARTGRDSTGVPTRVTAGGASKTRAASMIPKP